MTISRCAFACEKALRCASTFNSFLLKSRNIDIIFESLSLGENNLISVNKISEAVLKHLYNLELKAFGQEHVLSPIRIRQKYTHVNILRCANFTRDKQMAHANATTQRSIFTYG